MIFFDTPMQARTFLYLAVAGFACGGLLCLLRAARRTLPASVAAACDLLFWCLASAMGASALSFGGEGRVRWYAFLGMLIGVCLNLFMLRGVRSILRFISTKSRRKTNV